MNGKQFIMQEKNSDLVSVFEHFGISPEQFPDYSNANEFAGRFKRCSIMIMNNVRYSTAIGDRSELACANH